MIQALERIVRYLQTKVPRVAQSLQPGLTREQIEAQLQKLPFRLPEELYQLYGWRNGSLYGSPVELLPSYRILSLEEAIDRWEETDALGEDNHFSPRYWLPFLAEDSNYYVIMGGSDAKATAPILHFSYWNSELDYQFASLTDMMQAIAECFETGVYFFQEVDGDFYPTWHEVEMARIWLKYNPQRIANATAIIDNQAQQLSAEERQRAYGDLVLMQHPQALSVLMQAAEELEPEVKRLRFESYHAPTPHEKADAINALRDKEPKLQQLLDCISRINSNEAIQYLKDVAEQSKPSSDNIILTDAPVEHIQQPLLSAALTDALGANRLIQPEMLIASNFGLVATINHKTVIKAPDWLYVPQANPITSQGELRSITEGTICRSYMPHAEGGAVAVVMEFLSEEDKGELSVRCEAVPPSG